MRVSPLVLAICIGTGLCSAQDNADKKQEFTLSRRPSAQQNAFKVKYVAMDTVYLAAGRSNGLAEGMKLTIKRVPNVSTADTTGEGTGAQVIAELTVLSVTETSAVCNVDKGTADISKDDFAYLTAEQAEALAQQQALAPSRKYPQVIAFSEGDPLEEEIRDAVPHPPLPEVNRVRGRFGFDYSAIHSYGSTNTQSSQVGGVFRADITRMWGTYWNLSGYWRGRLSSTSSDQQQSLQDLINRTYHLSMTYDNPNSRFVAGFGRLFIPWASSLDTIDGGYVGVRASHTATLGLFAGTTPDPTSWTYDPNRRIGGAFIAFEGGSFDNVHYASTSGFGLSMQRWEIDRPFVFFENNIAFKKYVSIYHSLQADNPMESTGQTRVGTGISRSFATIRFQPIERLTFDLNHNYLRDVPTFDTRLIGTGLLDKYLFQGFSAGVRVETLYHVSLYTNIGRSNRSGDARASLNQMYGITAARLWRTGFRADLRYSEFDSSFGKGSYKAFSLSRTLREGMRAEFQVGTQSLISQFSSQGDSRFLNGNVDFNLGPRYFMQAGFTTERGGMFDYDQWSVTMGYRFDNRTSGAKQ